ncbi:hypothetical protein Clacol_004386 [Clathrus columnatus]|uniref:Uncharacterized protein n=1 Tax=Clathrus columnatus TaxID=1419009 RepID=A0AAV5AB70_9AGAM|nr:hypothetical protein Clacol_004386 [Clathrus columnatus]
MESAADTHARPISDEWIMAVTKRNLTTFTGFMDPLISIALELFRKEKYYYTNVERIKWLNYMELCCGQQTALYTAAVEHLLATTNNGDICGVTCGRSATRGCGGRGNAATSNPSSQPENTTNSMVSTREATTNPRCDQKAHGQGRGRVQGRGQGRSKTVHIDKELQLMQAIEPLEEEVRQSREQQCQVRLLQNARDEGADEVECFFSQPPPPENRSFFENISLPHATAIPEGTMTSLLRGQQLITQQQTPQSVRFNEPIQKTPLSIQSPAVQGAMCRTQTTQTILALKQQKRSEIWSFFIKMQTATANDISLRIVETVEFRELLSLLHNGIQILHCSTVCNMIARAWDFYFQEMQLEMKGSEGKILLTSDLWDDKSMKAYAGVMAHYAVQIKSGTCGKGDLILQASLIGFLPIPGKHRGQDIARSLLFVMDRAGISDKIFCITTDGASNMSAAIHDFEVFLCKRHIDFDSLTQHLV